MVRILLKGRCFSSVRSATLMFLILACRMKLCKYPVPRLKYSCRCKKCSYEFSSGKKIIKNPESTSLSSKKQRSLSKRRESDDADGSLPKTPTREERQEISSFSLEEESKSIPARRTLFEQGIEQKEGSRLRNDPFEDYEEEKKEAVRNYESHSSETDSDQEGESRSLRGRQRRR